MNDPGTIGILNVGAGDIRIELGDDQPEEKLATAARMVDDLFRSGYSILVEMPDGTTRRATAFDASARAYVITEPGKIIDVEPEARQIKGAGEPAAEGADQSSPQAPARRRGRPRKTLVPVATSQATAVARSAGG